MNGNQLGAKGATLEHLQPVHALQIRDARAPKNNEAKLADQQNQQFPNEATTDGSTNKWKAVWKDGKQLHEFHANQVRVISARVIKCDNRRKNER